MPRTSITGDVCNVCEKNNSEAQIQLQVEQTQNQYWTGGNLPMEHTIKSFPKFAHTPASLLCPLIWVLKIENENNRGYDACYVTSYPVTASMQSTVYTITNNLHHTFYVERCLKGI